MAPFIAMIGKYIVGEVVSSVVEGKDKPFKSVVKKGLIRSRTAKVATGMAGIMATIQMLPVDGDTKAWMTFGIIAVNWAAMLILRAVTKEPV